MRDPKRIKRILTLIETLWNKAPDQRFFQLLFNYTQLGVRTGVGTVQDPFHYEDDEIERQLKGVLDISKDG